MLVLGALVIPLVYALGIGWFGTNGQVPDTASETAILAVAVLDERFSRARA